MNSRSNNLNKMAIILFIFSLTNPLFQSYAKNSTPIKPSDDRAPIEGKVLEKIDASNYTYLRLKTTGTNEEVWVAVPQIDIKINAKASLRKPIPMFGYESKTLKRKFDRIYFGVLVEQANEVAEASSKGHWVPSVSKTNLPLPTHSAQSSHPVFSNTNIAPKSVVDVSQLRVKKAEGTNSVTISELYAKKENLREKTVIIRGKIVKYNAEILGKNWIHIADGTGDAKDKNNDLTVITAGKAKLGDTILVTGKVILDKKLDPYFFPIALEDAQIKIQ